MIDPFDSDPALLRHRERCAECARWAMDALGFERQLRQTVAVAPPRGLGRRIAAEHQRRAWRRRMGAGARLLLSLGLAGWLGYGLRGWNEPAPTLADVVREHIEREAPHLREHAHLSDAQVAAVLRQVGGDLMASLGQVDFAGLCPMRRALGAHLVIAGSRGPVTVLFMPGEHLQTAQQIRSDHLRGRVVPTRYGSLAVVGVPGERLDSLIERVEGSVSWRS